MKFILEYKDYSRETRSEELTLQEAVHIYKTKCSDWDLDGNFLYRYSKPNFDYSKMNPKNFKRVSLNTSNHYTILMDNYLESWSQYPNRGESLIMMGGDESKVRGSKMMIPFNNSKIGVCPKRDIWYSFQDEFDFMLDRLNDNFLSRLKTKRMGQTVHIGDEILKQNDMVVEYLKNYTYSDFKNSDIYENYVKTRQKYVRNPNTVINSFWEDDKEISLYELLNDYILNPKYNNFKLLSGKEFQSDPEVVGNECWSSDPFLIIQLDKHIQTKDGGGSLQGDEKWNTFVKLVNGDT